MRSSLKSICTILSLGCLSLFLGLFPLKAKEMSTIVICAETGKIHDAVNPDKPIPPASLTKMMTLYLTFKALQSGKLTLNQKMPVSHHASKQQPCKLWLRKGGFLTVKEAILGAVTKSANDASVVLAETLGNGSEKAFAYAMTQQAKKLGMKNTVFKNASGLPHKGQITTARDMAILSRALYKHFPDYFKFFGTKKFTYKGTTHPNHNKLLGKLEGVDGIKTGFTSSSGFNLAASIVRNNQRIIAVVLGGESPQLRNKKMTCLLEATYAKLQGVRRKGTSVADLITKCSTSGAKKVTTCARSARKKALRLASHKKKKGRSTSSPTKKKKAKLRKASYTSLNDIFAELETTDTPLPSSKLR